MVTIVVIMNTTIQISKETKELISSFGSKEDTYEEIIINIDKPAAIKVTLMRIIRRSMRSEI